MAEKEVAKRKVSEAGYSIAGGIGEALLTPVALILIGLFAAYMLYEQGSKGLIGTKPIDTGVGHISST